MLHAKNYFLIAQKWDTTFKFCLAHWQYFRHRCAIRLQIWPKLPTSYADVFTAI